MCAALAAYGTCQSHARKKIGDGRSRACCRGPQFEFRVLDVRASLQQTDRQPDRNLGRKTRSGSLGSQFFRQRLRILSEQDGDEVLAQLELARDRCEAGLECGELASRQRYIEFVCESLVETFLHELKALPGGFDVPAGNSDLCLKTSQFDVRAGNVGDHRYENSVAGLRRSQCIQMRGLDLATQLAKNIKLPRRDQAAGFLHMSKAGAVARAMQRVRYASAGIVGAASISGARRQVARRKSSANCDKFLGACLLQPRQRDGDIWIALDSASDKRNKLWIPEGTPPLLEIDVFHHLVSGGRPAVRTGDVAFRKPGFGKFEVGAHRAGRQTRGSAAGNPASKHALGKK